MNLLSGEKNLTNDAKFNCNYDIIKQELERISFKVETIGDKKYYYKNNGLALFACEDTINNTINIFYQVDYHATLTPLTNRIGTLTIAKDFLVFCRDPETKDLLYISTDAAFLDLKMHKGNYKKVIENSVITNEQSDPVLKRRFSAPNSESLLDLIYRNSTDGYVCPIGDINLSVPNLTKAVNSEIGLNILSTNKKALNLGQVESPAYKFYRKKRDWYYNHKAGRNVRKSTEKMHDCNFDTYGFSRDISKKYKDLYDKISSGQVFK